MKYRELGRTGWKVSEISFGAWAIGGAWGNVDDKESLAALHAALDGGVNFFDTADVYGDGRSEQLMAKLRKNRKERFYVATKAGRRLNPHTADGYNRANLTAFVERSLKNLETDAIDLLQLHCPPTEVYYRPEVFGVARRVGKGRQVAALRCERRKGRGGAQGHRVSRSANGANHLQYLPSAPGRIVFRTSATAQSRHPGARTAGLGAVVGQNHAQTASSPRTTTGISTVTARRLTGAKLFPAWILRPACARWSS